MGADCEKGPHQHLSTLYVIYAVTTLRSPDLYTTNYMQLKPDCDLLCGSTMLMAFLYAYVNQ